jgi:hypothetical protein
MLLLSCKRLPLGKPILFTNLPIFVPPPALILFSKATTYLATINTLASSNVADFSALVSLAPSTLLGAYPTSPLLTGISLWTFSIGWPVEFSHALPTAYVIAASWLKGLGIQDISGRVRGGGM